MKTKLGISAGLIGAAMYFLGLISGWFVLFLIAGYVLIREENQWLRYVAVKAIVLNLVFSVLYTVIGLIPDFLSFINSIVVLFDGTMSYLIVTHIINVIINILGLVETVLFLLLGLKALKQKDIRLGKLDQLIQAVAR